ALYTIRVHNPGSTPAANVLLTDVMPEGMKFLTASDGGQHDARARQVSWRLDEIGPGQTKQVQVELSPSSVGEFHQHIVAQSAVGSKAEAEVKTRAEGVAALVTELVDTEDPIEVGATTTYEVRMINTGSKEDTNVQLACVIPDKMEFQTAQAPTRYRV